MMRIGIALLAHDFNPGARNLVERLLQDYDCVVVHVDTKSPASVREAYEALAGDRLKVISTRKVVWGRWGMVSAVTDAVDLLLTSFPGIDYIALLSTSDHPIRSEEVVRDYLSKNPYDFIEAFDIFTHRWVLGGPQQERLYWWYPFDFWHQRNLFNVAYYIQNKLRLRRLRPAGYKYAIGSQWCMMRAKTWRMVVSQMKREGRFVRFMKSVWIPDETAIQTLVRTHVPENEIVHQSPTLYHYNEYGRPVQFFREHAELLSKQGFFFARKIAPSALALREELNRLALADRRDDSFLLGQKTNDLVTFGRAAKNNRPAFPLIHDAARAGPRPMRGRQYHVVFCQREIPREQYEAWCRHHFDEAEYVGPTFHHQEFVAPQWVYDQLDLGRSDTKVRDCFAHEILTLLIDHTPKAPVIVLPQDTGFMLIDRIISDPYANLVVLHTETYNRDGWLIWLRDQIRKQGAPYTLVHIDKGAQNTTSPVSPLRLRAHSG